MKSSGTLTEHRQFGALSCTSTTVVIATVWSGVLRLNIPDDQITMSDGTISMDGITISIPHDHVGPDVDILILIPRRWCVLPPDVCGSWTAALEDHCSSNLGFDITRRTQDFPVNVYHNKQTCKSYACKNQSIKTPWMGCKILNIRSENSRMPEWHNHFNQYVSAQLFNRLQSKKGYSQI